MRKRPVRGKVRILATGFGPFPGVPINVTAHMMEALASAPAIPGVELATLVLPVSWAEAASVAQSATRKFRPHAILHFGVSSRATSFVVETRAYNLRSGSADERGVAFQTCRISASAPAFLNSTLPCGELAAALRRGGLPASLSVDPGRYLCNTLLFTSLQAAAPGGARVAFVHVPALDVDGAVASTLTHAALVDGARILVRTAVRAVLRERPT
jgi:pyroglutamyl-peptidase